jgi:translation initiation factor IF-1
MNLKGSFVFIALILAGIIEAQAQENKLKGVVLQKLANGNFRLKLMNNNIMIGYLPGQVRKAFVRIRPGDTVTISMVPRDTTRGKIIYWRK